MSGNTRPESMQRINDRALADAFIARRTEAFEKYSLVFPYRVDLYLISIAVKWDISCLAAFFNSSFLPKVEFKYKLKNCIIEGSLFLCYYKMSQLGRSLSL